LNTGPQRSEQGEKEGVLDSGRRQIPKGPRVGSAGPIGAGGKKGKRGYLSLPKPTLKGGKLSPIYI